MSVNTKVRTRYYSIAYCLCCGRRVRRNRCKCGFSGSVGPIVQKQKQPGIDRWVTVKGEV